MNLHLCYTRLGCYLEKRLCKLFSERSTVVLKMIAALAKISGSFKNRLNILLSPRRRLVAIPVSILASRQASGHRRETGMD